jgi:nondiscriminating glutamyl-tRNA synthetase
MSHRMPRYMGKCRKLTPEQRKEKEDEGRKPSFRFKVPDSTIQFEDLIRGPMRFEGATIGDFIIVRSNGMPAYNFAAIIDDHLMGITNVIRGEDHLSNTALQIMLYRAFDFERPIFAHHCLILGRDRAKLSKRHGSVSVGEFRKQGILPEALMNYLGLLGSSFTDSREILSREEMIAQFAVERASKSGAIFDEEKLRWLNAIYIRNCKTEDLVSRLLPFLEEAGYKTDTIDPIWLAMVIELIKNDLVTLADIGNHIAIFFDNKYILADEAKKLLEKENAFRVVQTFTKYLQTSNSTEEEMYPAAMKYAREKTGAKGKDLFMPVRASLTGRLHGPELDKVFAILGKNTALKRLRSFIS